MTRWASCLLSKRINIDIKINMWTIFKEVSKVRVKKVHRCVCAWSRMIFLFFSCYFKSEKKKKKNESNKKKTTIYLSSYIFVFCTRPCKIGRCILNENSKYEKWTYVNDQRLVSFFINLLNQVHWDCYLIIDSKIKWKFSRG